MARHHRETSAFQRYPACALLLSMALAVGPGALPHAMAQDAPANVRELVIVAPRLTRRCRALDMTERPADLADLEARVSAWMATCVTSRTGDARRERALVHGNRSLTELFAALPAETQRIRIVPHYTFRNDRVVRVHFSAPDIPKSQPAAARSRASTASHASQPPARSAQPAPAGKPATVKAPPAAQPIDIMLPDDAQDLVLDVRALIERLREQGQTDDADRLERLANKAAKLLISLGALVGTYYVGTKFRAGKLLFMWGANAAGPHFQRALGRLQQLLPEVESALDQLVNAAKPYLPAAGAGAGGAAGVAATGTAAKGAAAKGAAATGAGAGLDWRVLDQIIDPSVPAQLDNAACGPACARMVLESRGIDLPQSELIERTRARLPPEIKSKFVTGNTMLGLLREVDPKGDWFGGQLKNEFLQGKTRRLLLESFGAKGSWIAQVESHFVVVDRFDSRTGHLFIRDPWYEPARERGIVAGTHYRVSVQTFFDHWVAVAVYRK